MRTLIPNILLLVAILLVACDQPATGTTAGSDDSSTSTAVPDSFALAYYTVADSFAFFKDNYDGPQANYKIRSLRVTNGSAAFRQLVADSLAADILTPDAVLPEDGDHAAAYAAFVSRNLDDYQLRNANEVDSEQAREMPQAYYESVEWTARPIYNQGGYLTVAHDAYSYSGGAHGIYGTTLHSFTDLSTRALALTDFLEGPVDTAALRTLLLSKIDAERLYDDEDPLPITHNIGLTDKGLLVIYYPYEIGPYAAGQIEAEVSFAELRAAGLTGARHPVSGE